jgi:hypothetical protein
VRRFVDIGFLVLSVVVFVLGVLAMLDWHPPKLVCGPEETSTREGEPCVVVRCHGVAP